MIFRNWQDFVSQVEEKLFRVPVNFVQSYRQIRESTILQGAGVILPLYFHQNEGATIRLIKRSRFVTQAGDLACPGGMLHPRKDIPLMYLIRWGLIPLLRNNAGNLLLQQGREIYETVTLFLATAVRESWEEVKMNPYYLRFLGALNTYALILYPRVIFPLVCFVKLPRRVQLNREVEKIVDIPLDSFFKEEQYGTLITEREGKEQREEHPCFIFFDSHGKENILWGATFFIIMEFLRLVFSFTLPCKGKGRVFTKVLGREYLNGVK